MALDAGAEDFASEDEVYIITTTPEDFEVVRESLEGNGIEFLEAEVKLVADTNSQVDMETAGKIQKMLDALEDDDDVQTYIIMQNSQKDLKSNSGINALDDMSD